MYGLAHCHCRSVLHRDIKLDNIILDNERGIKICDFGVSKIHKKSQVINEQCGTPAYIAPEIIMNEGYEGYHADIWSLGVLLYAMLTGNVPFRAPNIEELKKVIFKCSYKFPEELSEDAKNIITNMLNLVPEERISIPEILSHPWLQNIEDELGIEFENDYNERDIDMLVSRKDCLLSANPEELKSIEGNINYVNIDNIFNKGKFNVKLNYLDYCAISEDYRTQHINEDVLKTVESFGYLRSYILTSLNNGELNHATATYNLLALT